MQRNRFTISHYAIAVATLAALPLIYFISRHNYNLFHSLVDGASIVIAASAFTIIFSSRRLVDNNYFLCVGIAFLFFAFLDLLHMLGNKDMGVFPEYGNLGPTFYIASRYVLGISLLIAPLFINRKLNVPLAFAVYSLVTSLILLSVLSWNIFPVCIADGVGLTPFKIVSDYLVCLILLGAIGLLLINRRSFDSKVLRIIVWSISLSIATGLTFTLYTDPFGVTNILGHLFQIASFYLVYLAFVETGVTKPQDILFRKIKQNEEKLTENVQQLDAANGELKKEIAERKRAEEELQESRAKLETALSSMTDAVLISDGEGRIVDFNEAFATFHRFRDRDECYRSLAEYAPHVIDVFLPDESPVPPDMWAVPRALRGETVTNVEYTLRRTDTGETWFGSYSFSPIRDKDGVIVGSVVVGRDITDRKQAEEALRKAHDELEKRVEERTEELRQAYKNLKEETWEREQAEHQLRQSQKQEALGTLAGGIAHDFNNILAAIIGFTELAQDHQPVNSRQAGYLKKILIAGMRGRDLVKQMLTFSRKTEKEKLPLRLSSIVKETVRLLRASVPTTISIRTEVKSESGLILGDPVQVQQVLMNLATNAAHAMQEKGGILDIELSDFVSTSSGSKGNGDAIEPGAYMKLKVRDTGTGIPADIKEKIFDPFFTTKPVGQGTGLGLSVVMGIVKQSGGHITVESEPGRGSTFSVYFPRDKKRTIRDSDAADHDDIPAGSEHILLVDDEETLLVMGEELLTNLGYRVTSQMSSMGALALMKENASRFDLVITDQTMPDMTGMELAAKILALRPEMPVILCTGFSHLVDADSARAAGIKGFAMKPLTKKEIAKAIKDALQS